LNAKNAMDTLQAIGNDRVGPRFGILPLRLGRFSKLKAFNHQPEFKQGPVLVSHVHRQDDVCFDTIQIGHERGRVRLEAR